MPDVNAGCKCNLDVLRVLRAVNGLSLSRAARGAGISAAYLQKLERGHVTTPSPRALYGLARLYNYPYERLMELCDYPIPGRPEPRDYDRVAELAEAFERASLTNEEAEALAMILAEYRAAAAAGVDINFEFLVRAVREYREARAAGLDLALGDIMPDERRGRRVPRSSKVVSAFSAVAGAAGGSSQSSRAPKAKPASRPRSRTSPA
jgi:transcriptional regulator with XRE-family HTH domain